MSHCWTQAAQGRPVRIGTSHTIDCFADMCKFSVLFQRTAQWSILNLISYIKSEELKSFGARVPTQDPYQKYYYLLLSH